MVSRSFAARLLAWYDTNKRALPWRDVGDPWATWVSEVMLQQTRVEAVREAFTRFMRRYPTPKEWAATSDGDLLHAWQGLGYYRRARLLRAGARACVAEHRGRVPDDLAALGKLPGVGTYTAGAIASIAFGRAIPAIDGNVERVLARHRGVVANVKTGAGAKAVRAAVTAALDATRPGDFNQALMDLGAKVCTAKTPQCQECPLVDDCVARHDGTQTTLPTLPARQKAIAVRTRVVFAHLDDGRVLGQAVGEREINAGQVDLPGPGPLIDVTDAEELQAWLDARIGQGALRVDLEPTRVVRHTITKHRITVDVHRGALATRRLRAGWILAQPDDPRTPWTTIARKAMAKESAPRAMESDA